MESDDEIGTNMNVLPADSPPSNIPIDPASNHIPTQLLTDLQIPDSSHSFPLQQPTPVHVSTQPRAVRPRGSVSQAHAARRSIASIKAGPAMAINILPSAPASPPTPAPSPTPYQRPPSWTSAGENEFSFLRDARGHFSGLSGEGKQRYLAELLNMCDSHLLSFVMNFVSPRLKKDPFEHLPDELCLRVRFPPGFVCSLTNATGLVFFGRAQSSCSFLTSFSKMA